MQFWSEIKFVTTNRTPTARSCEFVITRLISDQDDALHSVQLQSLIRRSRIQNQVSARISKYANKFIHL